jgi:hypothetical protein
MILRLVQVAMTLALSVLLAHRPFADKIPSTPLWRQGKTQLRRIIGPSAPASI